jgi:hypothetical protein
MTLLFEIGKIDNLLTPETSSCDCLSTQTEQVSAIDDFVLDEEGREKIRKNIKKNFISNPYPEYMDYPWE